MCRSRPLGTWPRRSPTAGPPPPTRGTSWACTTPTRRSRRSDRRREPRSHPRSYDSVATTATPHATRDGQCLGQCRDLRPQPAFGQLGQLRRVALAVDERIAHRRPETTGDVRGDRGQLDAGVLQRRARAQRGQRRMTRCPRRQSRAGRRCSAFRWGNQGQQRWGDRTVTRPGSGSYRSLPLLASVWCTRAPGQVREASLTLTRLPGA
jgi:hypothetical protein